MRYMRSLVRYIRSPIRSLNRSVTIKFILDQTHVLSTLNCKQTQLQSNSFSIQLIFYQTHFWSNSFAIKLICDQTQLQTNSFAIKLNCNQTQLQSNSIAFQLSKQVRSYNAIQILRKYKNNLLFTDLHKTLFGV